MSGTLMQEEFRDAVFEFVKQVSNIPKIYGIFLFGSVAKEEADKRSDIDFLIVLDTLQDPDMLDERNRVSKIALDLEKRFDRNIQLVFSNARFDKLDTQFIETVLSEGIILFGRPLIVADNKVGFSPYELIYYELRDLSASDKMKVKRALYGYETKRSFKGKIYASNNKGLVNELDGKRTGIASVLLPHRKSQPLLETLERFGAKISKEMVWLPEIKYASQFDTEKFSSNVSLFRDIQEKDTKERILETIRDQITDLPHDGMSDDIRSNVVALLYTLQDKCNSEMRRHCLDILSIVSRRRDEVVNAKMKELFLDNINKMYPSLSVEEKINALGIIQTLQRFDAKILDKLIVDAIETWTTSEFQNLFNSVELSTLNKNQVEQLRKRLWNWRADAMAKQEKEKVERIDKILGQYIFH
jgi:predicted nucleotidyltransferase